MTLQTTGPISFEDIQDKFGGTNPISLNEYYRGGIFVPNISTNSDIPTGSVISMQNFYGATNYTPITSVSISVTGNQHVDCNADWDDNPSSCNPGTAKAIFTAVVTGGNPSSYQYQWIKVSGSASHSGSGSSKTFSLSGNSLGPQATSSATGSWQVRVYDTANGDPVGITSAPASYLLSRENTGNPPPCFHEDTPILLSGNIYKLAKDLVVGDELMAFNTPTMIDESDPDWRDWQDSNIANGVQTTSTVTAVHSRTVDGYYKINDHLKMTGKHPILIKRNGFWQWINVENLTVGDVCLGSNGAEITLTSITYSNEQVTVIAISVEDVDTYYGGDLGNGISILVHNK